MTQSKAIFRLMARKHGYYPADVELAFICDWIIETYYDAFDSLVAPTFIMMTGGSKEQSD